MPSCSTPSPPTSSPGVLPLCLLAPQAFPRILISLRCFPFISFCLICLSPFLNATHHLPTLNLELLPSPSIHILFSCSIETVLRLDRKRLLPSLPQVGPLPRHHLPLLKPGPPPVSSHLVNAKDPRRVLFTLKFGKLRKWRVEERWKGQDEGRRVGDSRCR